MSGIADIGVLVQFPDALSSPDWLLSRTADRNMALNGRAIEALSAAFEKTADVGNKVLFAIIDDEQAVIQFGGEGIAIGLISGWCAARGLTIYQL